MVHTTKKPSTETDQREAVRQQLLRMILRNESQRRDQRKALDK